jgi:SAM-dependent methyltransferase
MKDEQTVCRSCGKTELSIILSLGQTPLANALLTTKQVCLIEPTYPLDLAFCQNCALVQITETVPPEKLFREYPYLSSFSDTMLRHSYELVKRLILDRHLETNSLVIEIGSNDGYLLQYYKQEGIPVLGVEPATNIARMARDVRGIDTMAQFFSETLARQLREKGQQADVIHAHNVLAHVVDLNGVVSGIGVLLKDNGIAVIEVPYVKDLIDHTEFDTIYHEHLCYFSLTALKCLFKRNQLVIVEVERLPIHGGSLRILIEKMKTTEDTEDFPSVRRLMEEETLEGLNRVEFYQSFADKVENLRHDLTDLLRRLKGQNKRIVAYGASAKGTMLLTHFGIGQEILDYVVDRSTVKQGLLTPGTHLPIYAPEKLVEDQPDYVLLLTWNFAEEIMEQQAEYYKRGGKFIIPIPEVKVV